MHLLRSIFRWRVRVEPLVAPHSRGVDLLTPGE